MNDKKSQNGDSPLRKLFKPYQNLFNLIIPNHVHTYHNHGLSISSNISNQANNMSK